MAGMENPEGGRRVTAQAVATSRGDADEDRDGAAEGQAATAAQQKPWRRPGFI